MGVFFCPALLSKAHSSFTLFPLVMKLEQIEKDDVRHNRIFLILQSTTYNFILRKNYFPRFSNFFSLFSCIHHDQQFIFVRGVWKINKKYHCYRSIKWKIFICRCNWFVDARMTDCHDENGSLFSRVAFWVLVASCNRDVFCRKRVTRCFHYCCVK